MDIQGNSALILIDMQQGINHPKLGRRNNPQAEANIGALLSAWRQSGRPVIHVRHFSTSPQNERLTGLLAGFLRRGGQWREQGLQVFIAQFPVAGCTAVEHTRGQR